MKLVMELADSCMVITNKTNIAEVNKYLLGERYGVDSLLTNIGFSLQSVGIECHCERCTLSACFSLLSVSIKCHCQRWPQSPVCKYKMSLSMLASVFCL